MSSRPDPSTSASPPSDEFSGGGTAGDRDGGAELPEDTVRPAGAGSAAEAGSSTARADASRHGPDDVDGDTAGPVAPETGAGERPVGRTAPRFGPRALRKPGRGETSVRDMIGALLILLPVGLLLFSVGNSCSFAPGMPVEDPNSGPTVNASARLAEYAVGSAFPLRVPDVPFRANSTDRGPVDGGGTAVRIGYVTPDADFLSLVQTDGTAEGVLATESGAAGRGDGPPLMRGTVDAGGLDWEVYQREGGEPFRIATLPGDPEVRLLITGSGSDEQFRILAEAVVEAPTVGGG
ncbi:DUF4245 family protein [Pseudonocardia sp. NPDC049635]|uniref:DUF4245 family protein n=1 Tax=Pseudonocardia sp. NPDC049635 TaxID=3155506 RepID=UPI0034050381